MNQNQLADQLFGMAAVELGRLSSSQVGTAMMQQAQAPQYVPLSQLCVERGLLPQAVVQEVVQRARTIHRRLDAEASLFGRVATTLGLLSAEQLNHCVGLQRQGGYQKKLGEVCVEAGYLRPEGVKRILEQQEQYQRRMAHEAPVFGQAALAAGMLSKEQLDAALAQQRDEGYLRSVGDICVERGYLNPSQVDQVLRGDAKPAQAAAGSQVSGSGREPKINKMLRQMVKFDASDLHLSAAVVPFMRVHGAMKAAGKKPFSDAEIRDLMFPIMPKGPRQDFEDKLDADFAHEIEGVARFRVNVFVDRKGMGAVFRQIPYKIQRPKELGLPPQVVELCWLSKGLVLVTGPTGSGKSTTLASLVDYINRNRDDHIVTIEDPIEFVHENKKCLVNQREVGTHTKSFKNALRAALREDPDIVLVGEMRDLETIAIAIETAETGHLVFGTLHTTSAPTTVDRVIEQFPGNQQAQIRTMLAESLRGVVAQVLCRKMGGGRVAAFEILIGTSAVGNIIREGKTEQIVSIMQVGRQIGMQTMNEHLLSLVTNRLVEPKEAYIKSNDKHGIVEMFDKAGIVLPKELTQDQKF